MVTSVQQEASRPMVHQRQPDEYTCWITVVAMLADIPVEQLLAEIREEFGASYQEMWMGDITEVASWAEGRFGFNINPRKRDHVRPDVMADRLRTLMKAVKLYSLPSGRGAISLVVPGFRIDDQNVYRLQKHTVAYSDGMVYDPSSRKPMSLAQFRHEFAKCLIDQTWEVR